MSAEWNLLLSHFELEKAVDKKAKRSFSLSEILNLNDYILRGFTFCSKSVMKNMSFIWKQCDIYTFLQRKTANLSRFMKELLVF